MTRFTFIEWLIVILIVGMLVALAVVAWGAIVGPSDAERLRDCLASGGQWIQVNRSEFTCVAGGR